MRRTTLLFLLPVIASATETLHIRNHFAPRTLNDRGEAPVAAFFAADSPHSELSPEDRALADRNARAMEILVDLLRALREAEDRLKDLEDQKTIVADDLHEEQIGMDGGTGQREAGDGQ
jgi:hypothetical protein